MIIKEYDESYQNEVLTLFKDVFCKKLSKEFWPWRLNEFGTPLRYVMIDQKKIVGHYVVHPIPLQISGEKIKALFSMSVMTHPKFRNQGIFPSLAKKIYERANSLGYEIIFGFPNENSSHHHFEKLGWQNHGKILEYTIKTTLCINENDCDISEISPNDERIDEIWNRNKENYSVIVPRTSAFIKWRFFSQPKPIFLDAPDSFYKIFLVTQQNFPKAYFVLKYFNSEKSHIVDFFGDLDENIFRSIINHALIFSRQQKSKYLSFWPGDLNRTHIQKISHDLGFIKNESTSFFGTKCFSGDPNQNIKNWYITMADSDIF